MNPGFTFGSGTQPYCGPGYIAVIVEINPYNSAGAIMEVVGTIATTMVCGTNDVQLVATIRFNAAFRGISDAGNCERITKTSPSRDINDCCTTNTVVGTWITYDEILDAITYADGLPDDEGGSGTALDPWRIAA